METRNAIIKSASIRIDRDLLTAWVYVDYGGAGQGFGGIVLYLPQSFAHHHQLSPAGHFIYRVLTIAGVESWSDLPGKAIRVRADSGKISSIGHILNEDWFTPEIDFKTT